MIESRKLFGTCALCHNENRPLKKSHFLPHALYRLVRFSETSRPQVFANTVEGSWRTDKQVAQHLLCEMCEQRFHNNGEDWLLRQVYRGKDVFRLLDILNTLTPLGETPIAIAYCVDRIEAINRSKLAYFAMSVFWRGAITEWNIGGRHIDRINFGPQYTDAVRQYLLGRTSFPEQFALMVEVCDVASARALAFTTPTLSGRSRTFHAYRFVVPGIAFQLHVGKGIPSHLLDTSLAGGDSSVILRIAAQDFLSYTVHQKTKHRKRPRIRLQFDSVRNRLVEN